MPAEECYEDFGGVFLCERLRRSDDVPPIDRRIIDVAILDMHHEWPNLGHDSLVRAVGEIAHDLRPLLDTAGIRIRTLSYDVRRSLMIPDEPGDRHFLYIGTGGPGHIDPRRNDGLSEGTQGIREDASWESPLFRLFDSIAGDSRAVLLAVCHTFGVLCRWAGVARPVLRGPEKGGKSSGVRENALTSAALSHPWFGRLAPQLSDGRHVRILDSRLFDLVPESAHFPGGVLPIGFDVDPRDRSDGEAVTMLEFARDMHGMLPRIFAVNHHPEVRDGRRQLHLLNRKLSRGEVTREWYDERLAAVRQMIATTELQVALTLTSQYTLLAPLRYHLYRQVRVRAAELGCPTDLNESQVLSRPSGTLEREPEFS
jgi:hypothetical protein